MVKIQLRYYHRIMLIFFGIIIILIPVYVELRDILFFKAFLLKSDSALASAGAFLVAISFPGGIKGRLLLLIFAITGVLLSFYYELPEFTLPYDKHVDLDETLRRIGGFLLGGIGVTIIFPSLDKS